jgi:Flp pilus assembly protein CpaB
MALLASVVTLRSVSAATALRDTYGHRIGVTVARSDLAVGHVINTRDLERRELPAGLVADGAAADPLGRTVIEPIVAGEVIIDRRLSGSPAAGLDALIAAGSRAVTLERTGVTPPVDPGDRVDLFAPAARGTVVRIARRARVIEVTDRTVTVAVAENEAPAVARASIESTLAMALIGAG